MAAVSFAAYTWTLDRSHDVVEAKGGGVKRM